MYSPVTAAATRPMGTILSLFPFPRVRMASESRSMSPTFICTSSLTRMPVE